MPSPQRPRQRTGPPPKLSASSCASSSTAQREAREHNAWFRAEVQQALRDPRPGIPHDAVMAETRAIIDRMTSKKARRDESNGIRWPART